MYSSKKQCARVKSMIISKSNFIFSKARFKYPPYKLRDEMMFIQNLTTNYLKIIN